MASDSVIATDRLVVRFRGKAALDGFTLAVPRGSVLALLGDNGAGKSTCMKVLTGQLRPDSGSASILGQDCWAKATQLRHRVGYVPDRPRLYDWMSVAEIGWFTAGFYGEGFLDCYENWVVRLRLDRSKRLRDLSKGGYARVGLALALAPDPDVLLLDEPTSGLDLQTRREFLASLVDFAAEGGTVLISSHSIAELERTASHAAFIRDGKVTLTTTLDDLRSRFRRISMRTDGLLPDPVCLGTVHDCQRTGRFVQYLVQDPDPATLESLRDSPGITDLEDLPISLEEIYAAIMGRPGTPPEAPRESTAVDAVESQEVRP